MGDMLFPDLHSKMNPYSRMFLIIFNEIPSEDFLMEKYPEHIEYWNNMENDNDIRRVLEPFGYEGGVCSTGHYKYKDGKYYVEIGKYKGRRNSSINDWGLMIEKFLTTYNFLKENHFEPVCKVYWYDRS
jgi:hypothetical protein